MDSRSVAIIGDSSSVLPTTSYSSTDLGAESVFTRSKSVRTELSSRYWSKPSINQTVGDCGSKPAAASAAGPVVGQVGADRRAPTARPIIGKQVGFGGDHRRLVQLVDRRAIGPVQPVGPRIHSGREDNDLLGHPGRAQQGIVEKPGAHDDLRSRTLTGSLDRGRKQLSAGVPRQFVGEWVGEEPVIAG